MLMFVPITVARRHDWQLHQNHKKEESCYQKNEGREGRCPGRKETTDVFQDRDWRVESQRSWDQEVLRKRN